MFTEVPSENLPFNDRLGINEAAIRSRVDQEDPMLINTETMANSLREALKDSKPIVICDYEGTLLVDILKAQETENLSYYIIDGNNFDAKQFYQDLTGQEYQDLPMMSTIVREAIAKRKNPSEPCIIFIRNIDQIKDLTTRETIGRISSPNIKTILELESGQQLPPEGAQQIFKKSYSKKSEYYKLIHPEEKPAATIDIPQDKELTTEEEILEEKLAA